MSCSEARWWRVTLRYRGQILEDRRFAENATIPVGEGAPSVVLPGVTGALVEAGRLSAPSGLRPLDRPGEFEVADAPDVTVTARLEHAQMPRFARGIRMPWRELSYGASLAGCLAALLWAHDAASAAPAGTEADMSGRMERVLLAPAPLEAPTVASFAAPVPVPESDSESDSGSDSASDSVSASDSDPEVPASDSGSDSDSEAEGLHSHSADGTEAGGPEDGHAVASAHVCDDPEAEPKDNVDVVFVVDVSTTMTFALDRLAGEISALDASVRDVDPDRRYGLVLFVDDVLVTEGNPYTDIAELRRDFERWSRFTSTNRQLHSSEHNRDWPENGLDALVAAAERFDWRDADDTLRLVVYASDDDFGEAGAVQSGQRVRHDYDTTVAALQDAAIRVASFTAPIGGQCECEDVRPGFISDYRGKPAIPVATGGAAFDIDAVAAKTLHFDRALAGLIENLVCED